MTLCRMKVLIYNLHTAWEVCLIYRKFLCHWVHMWYWVDDTYDQEALLALKSGDSRVSTAQLPGLAPTPFSSPWTGRASWSKPFYPDSTAVWVKKSDSTLQEKDEKHNILLCGLLLDQVHMHLSSLSHTYIVTKASKWCQWTSYNISL